MLSHCLDRLFSLLFIMTWSFCGTDFNLIAGKSPFDRWGMRGDRFICFFSILSLR